MNNLNTKIIFATRDQDGLVQQYDDIISAMNNFLSDDGYRLDFIMEDGRILHIHRSEFDLKVNDNLFGVNHPALQNYFKADAKIVLLDKNKRDNDANIIKVHFNQS